MNRDNVITYVVHLNLKTSHRPPAFQEIDAIITKNIMLVMLPRFHASTTRESPRKFNRVQSRNRACPVTGAGWRRLAFKICRTGMYRSRLRRIAY